MMEISERISPENRNSMGKNLPILRFLNTQYAVRKDSIGARNTNNERLVMKICPEFACFFG